jgi:hypothetical protein
MALWELPGQRDEPDSKKGHPMLATLSSIYKHIDTNQNIFIQRLIEYVRHPSMIAQGFYRKHLGHLITARTNWSVVIAFYLLFVLGLTILVIIPV